MQPQENIAKSNNLVFIINGEIFSFYTKCPRAMLHNKGGPNTGQSEGISVLVLYVEQEVIIAVLLGKFLYVVLPYHYPYFLKCTLAHLNVVCKMAISKSGKIHGLLRN